MGRKFKIKNGWKITSRMIPILLDIEIDEKKPIEHRRLRNIT